MNSIISVSYCYRCEVLQQVSNFVRIAVTLHVNIINWSFQVYFDIVNNCIPGVFKIKILAKDRHREHLKLTRYYQ